MGTESMDIGSHLKRLSAESYDKINIKMKTTTTNQQS